MNVLFNKEPDFTISEDDPEYSHKLLGLLQYAHAILSDKDYRNAVEVQYGEFLGETIKNIPDFEFRTLGKICWLLNNGGLLSAHDINFARDIVVGLKEKYRVLEDNSFKDPYMTKDRVVLRAINKIDQMIISNVLDTETLKLIKYSEYLNDIKDHYENLSLSSSLEWKTTISQILGVLTGKAISSSANLVFGSKDKANSVVLHSAKDDRIILLIAEPGKKISIKGKKFINWSEELSFSKKMKNPEIDLKAISSAQDLNRVLTILTQGITGKKAAPKARISDFVKIKKIFQ